MQQILRYLLIAIVIIAAGCGDDNPTGNDTANGSISAKVDGAAWSATNVQASNKSGVLGIGGAQISGAENKQINIAGLVSGVGTYQLGLFSGITVTYAEGSLGNIKTFVAHSGTLKVDELSSSGAKGTFSFEAREQNASGAGSATRTVSDGTFNVKF